MAYLLSSLAEGYRRTMLLDRAKEIVERAIKLDRELPDACYVAARIAKDEGDSKTAKCHLQNALKLDPEYFDALELLKEAATSAEPDPRMLLHLADAFRLAGKLDQARKALDEANRRKVTQQLLTPTDRQLVKELSAKLGGR